MTSHWPPPPIHRAGGQPLADRWADLTHSRVQSAEPSGSGYSTGTRAVITRAVPEGERVRACVCV